MSGIIDVKNESTNVRKKAAKLVKFTSYASGTPFDGSSCSTGADSTGVESSAGGTDTGDDESLSVVPVLRDSTGSGAVPVAAVSFSGDADFVESFVVSIVGAGAVALFGASSWSLAGASANGCTGAPRARGSAFARTP